jgi:hypothetical protein
MLQILQLQSRYRGGKGKASKLPFNHTPLVSLSYPLRYSPVDDSLAERVMLYAIRHFINILGMCADHQAPFRTLVTIEVDGEHKPLLLVGTAHGAVEDGSVIAVLNPDQELVDKLSGAWGCNSAIFREAVAQKCDLALNIWVDAYKQDGVCVMTKYIARQAMPAKFRVAGSCLS